MIGSQDVKTSSLEQNQEQGLRSLERLFATSDTRAVYSEPVVAGVYTMITASEVACGGGFGLGSGFGPARADTEQMNGTPRPATRATTGGGGMGAGGGAMGRPVAIVAIGPDGVTVKPVLDLTKLALAALTAWAGMLAVVRRGRKARGD